MDEKLRPDHLPQYALITISLSLPLLLSIYICLDLETFRDTPTPNAVSVWCIIYDTYDVFDETGYIRMIRCSSLGRRIFHISDRVVCRVTGH